MKTKIYILCPVTVADKKQKERLSSYVAFLEDQGYEVYYPARDTDQSLKAQEKFYKNTVAMIDADEVHIFYDDHSLGSHSDIGIVYFLKNFWKGKKKKVVVVEARLSRVDSTGFIGLLKDMED
jgi:hypothetical protein